MAGSYSPNSPVVVPGVPIYDRIDGTFSLLETNGPCIISL